ncbi:hypothetical protein KR49_00645 [Synechococcus sp. KORDI-49]|nr:hypothetical protein KR49_00645 [Synechococcus sp. KORDI-49]
MLKRFSVVLDLVKAFLVPSFIRQIRIGCCPLLWCP